MYRGDTFVYDTQLMNPLPGPTQGKVPQNLTGWTLWFTAKYQAVDADQNAVIQQDNATVGGVVVVGPATNGNIAVTAAPLSTRGFPDAPVTLVYDIQGKDGSGRIFTMETGTLTVAPDVTRAIA